MNITTFMKCLASGFSLTLIFLGPLHAQTGANAPETGVTANPVPANQAPDDKVKAVSDLVHAGNYPQAQQMVAILLSTYPSDQRLIQAKALFDKLVAAQPTNAAAGATQSAANATPIQQTVGSTSETLTGMDRVDYNALIQRVRDAQQTTDLAQQKTLLKQFMTDSSLFLQMHPEQMLIWQLRAASAISLDSPDAGYEAGQKLVAAGAADSNDPNLQQLLVQLKNKGWLDKKIVEDETKYDWLVGRWNLISSASGFTWHVLFSTEHEYEFLKFGSGVEGYAIRDGKMEPAPTLKYTLANSDETSLPKNWAANQNQPIGANSERPDWVPITSFLLSSDKKTMSIVFDMPSGFIASTFTFVFTKLNDAQSE